MKRFFGFRSALLGVSLALSSHVCAGDVALPDPVRTGGMSLADALNSRKTVRTYQETALTPRQFADLLWAANGINRDNGRRTAPSAINRQEIEIFVLTADGGYFWNPAKNTLEQRTTKDVRGGAGFFKAPVYLVLAADLDRAANEHFAKIDTGYVSQNIYLHCAASGLGTCAIGSFNKPKNKENFDTMCKELQLREKELVLLTHSVGVPR